MLTINLLEGLGADNRKVQYKRGIGIRASRNYRARHPERCRVSSKNWKDRNPEANRAAAFKLRYEITLEQYREILAAQGGHCAVCPRTTGRGEETWLYVDHDHETGVVRGLLCLQHNTALGLVEDRVQELRALANYLEISRGS